MLRLKSFSLKPSPPAALMLATLILILWAVCAAAAEPALPAEEIQRLGERMYRDGRLPSGEPMKAFVSNDVPVDGTTFTCVSCHLRSGLGSIEGEVVTPPTNGRHLYEERHSYIKGSEHIPSIANYAKYLPVRPAYDDESLATLISAGIDPTGRSVLKAMPRYELEDRDMAILIAYLKTLSDQRPPGVEEKKLHFATVIVEGSDPRAVRSMLQPLQFSIDWKNSQAVATEANQRMARMSYNMIGHLFSYTFSLSQWVLKGPPESWRAQLEEYYAKEPVYALLGGISPGTWEPVHRFCEDHRIPDLFPIVDDPVISERDWYTLYLSRGVRQEGEAAARHLAASASLFAGRPVVQLFRDNRRGRLLAEGFRSTWNGAGHPAAIDVPLAADAPLTAEALNKLVAANNPAVLLIWDDAALIGPLAGMMSAPERPAMVMASAAWLGERVREVPETLREALFLTWPYRLPHDEARFDTVTRKVLAGRPLEGYDPVVLRQAYAAQELLGSALMEMRGEYYRDFLLDTIGMMEDAYYPLYERLSFGPGQRYASKGCFIIQLGKGDNPPFNRLSEWVIR